MKTIQEEIKNFFKDKGRMPGYIELMNMTGYKSKNAIYKLINKLVTEKFLSKDEKGRLSLVELDIYFENDKIVKYKSDDRLGIPMLGLVEAGFPTYTDENFLDTIDLDDFLVNHRKNTFMLEVKGESMRDEGIMDGDYVIVEKTNTARIDDIVVAEVDGGFTLKYLKRKGERYYLKPANSDFKDIYPTSSFKILAVVRGVVRKY